ncbi:hypothetical protein COU54_03990 [Candidatus Pacearchaeota archaeon CG10_big_fil_rev_8_21_14_0_10_31_24]|nr:MAG: hypothetical protein COU54_03990 [Candidatus Pacearchaeota archaeon CG10_big_fil_rev_8_21_14_0_10_31_24]
MSGANKMVKTSITISLDQEAIKILEKRAKNEFLSLSELITNILRRSAISSSKKPYNDNIKDKYLTYFSRKTRVKKK